MYAHWSLRSFSLCSANVLTEISLNTRNWNRQRKKQKRENNPSPNLCRLLLCWSSPSLIYLGLLWTVGISLRWKLKVFSGLFWACILLGYAYGCLKPSIYVAAFEYPNFSKSVTPAASAGFRWSILCLHPKYLALGVLVYSPLVAYMSSVQIRSGLLFLFVEGGWELCCRCLS